MLKSFLSEWLKSSRNSLEKLLSKDNENGEVLQQSDVWIRSTTFGLIGSATFAISWLALATTDEVVTVSGKLVPLGSVQEIQMPVGGIVSEILVKEGAEVEPGQVVMRLDAEATEKRLSSLNESQQIRLRQLDLKNSELKQYLLLNTKEISILEKNLDLHKNILNRFFSLQKAGATSELQYLQQVDKVNNIIGQIERAHIDRSRQSAVLNQQIQQLKSQLKEQESLITEATVNLRYQELKSPVKGIVFDLQPRGEGYVAKGTETVMKVVPYDNLQANVEIPSNQIGFVAAGMDVDLSIDSFPASDFGVLGGIVKNVGSDALAPSQIDNRPDYRFPAQISLNSQKLKLKNGNELPLQAGMSLTSSIKLRKVSYLQLLLGTFQEKVDSLRQI